VRPFFNLARQGNQHSGASRDIDKQLNKFGGTADQFI
jgi:hypothetical protein